MERSCVNRDEEIWRKAKFGPLKEKREAKRNRHRKRERKQNKANQRKRKKQN